MTSPFDHSIEVAHSFHRVAILFAGGPAPAANAVISTAAVSFLRHGAEVLGIRNGYSRLLEFGPDHPLEEGRDYLKIDHAALKRTRNRPGVMIGTARANPSRLVKKPADLDDPECTAPLRTVYDALRSLGVDALISIGGDDTLKSANMFCQFQRRLPAGEPRIPVVHVPKTIDNDYNGIDFTFGYFTAVDTLAREVHNLLFDAEATDAYFLAETMGRSAGWLSYGAAIAGEASLVIGLEDMTGKYLTKETVVDPETGVETQRDVMDVSALVDYLVGEMLLREKEGKNFGVVVLAEGLVEVLPSECLTSVATDAHGHMAVGSLNLARMFELLVAEAYTKRTGRNRKVRGVQLGYEARCAKPHAFDVILASQLGVGAFRALAEQGLNGVMISVVGQLQLHYVPFESLIDQETLTTTVRKIEPGSDFHRLARFLETYH